MKLLITLLSRAILRFNYIIVENPRIFLASNEYGYPFIVTGSLPQDRDITHAYSFVWKKYSRSVSDLFGILHDIAGATFGIPTHLPDLTATMRSEKRHI